MGRGCLLRVPPLQGARKLSLAQKAELPRQGCPSVGDGEGPEDVDVATPDGLMVVEEATARLLASVKGSIARVNNEGMRKPMVDDGDDNAFGNWKSIRFANLQRIDGQ